MSTHLWNIQDVTGIIRYLSYIPSKLSLEKLNQVLNLRSEDEIFNPAGYDAYMTMMCFARFMVNN